MDIVVVGAGVVGCAIAAELARRGASVEIVDDRPAGMGATQAAAGVLAPFIEARDEGPLLELTSRSLNLYDEFVARTAKDGGIPVRYHRTGSLDVALKNEAMERFRRQAADLSRLGVEAELVDRTRARTLEPHLTADVQGGLFVPTHGFVAAAELTRALAATARHHGAQLIEQGRVQRVFPAGGDLMVQTDRGSLIGQGVVIAGGSWSSQIDVAGAARVPIRPVRGQLLQLAWQGQPLRRVTWSERCYLVPWDDGTLLAGATMEEAGFDERTTAAGVRHLLEAASELAPHCSTASFTAARVGLRPCSPDGLPVIGRSCAQRNVVYATGHFRNGVLLAPLTARLVADLLLDDKTDPALEFTSPQRFGAV